MASGTIFSWALIGVAVLGIAYLVWRMWSARQADRQYARLKAGTHTDVHHALQGRSFIVGTPSELSQGDLLGHFGWLSGQRAWGLRLRNPKSSLRSLEGTSIPLWVRHSDANIWVRHTEGSLRLRANDTDVSLVFPQSLNDADQIRLGDCTEDQLATESPHA